MFVVGHAVAFNFKALRQTGACRGNKPGINCESYGVSVCSDSTYAAWVADNCCFYCMLHKGTTNTGGGVVSGPMVGGGTGVQAGGMSAGSSCTGDKAGVDCSSYGTNVCSDARYTSWVADNCCFYCMTHGGGSGTPSSHTFNGHSTGCVYGGSVYQQGETWKDACKYSCTCNDASTGAYTCKSLCLTWNTLPDVCHMSQPGPGLCCPTPSCPSSVQIQYPPGYIPQ